MRDEKAMNAWSPNSDVFFLLHEGNLVAWDYSVHKQYVLDLTHIRCLIDDPYRNENPQAWQDLIDHNLVVRTDNQTNLDWGWDLLSKIFHIGTSRSIPPHLEADPQKNSRQYVDYCNSIKHAMPKDAFATTRGTGSIKLAPHSQPNEVSLLDALQNRRSSRNFSGEAIRFDDLSTILDHALTYKDHDAPSFKKKNLETPTKRRSSPSGGSLQSCEAYLVARKVKGLEPGVYHYRSHKPDLGRISDLPTGFSFGALLGDQMFADDLSAALILTCRFDKMMWKYSQSRSYRVALMDAGHLSQTIQLLATAANIRTWITAAFFDDQLSDFLGIEPSSLEFPLSVVGLGTGNYDPVDKNLITAR